MSEASPALDWERVRAELLARIGTIEAVLLECLTGNLRIQDFASARRAAHQLAGSLGSFGLQESSNLAARLEEQLKELQSPEDAHRISYQVADLRRQLQSSTPPQMREDAQPATNPGHIVFFEPPPALAELVKQQRNPTLVVARRGELNRWSPFGTVLVGELDARTLEEAVSAARAGPGESRLLALARSDLEPTGRLKAIRSGVVRFLDYHADPQEILSEVVQVAQQGVYRPRVLSLDDDKLFQKVLRRLVEGQGMQLETANNLDEFWESLNKRRPDVIMLDLSMPEVSGQELTLLLRADPRTEALPLFLVTASEDDETRENLYAAGADDVLYKPIRSRELLFRIRNRLQRMNTLRTLGLREIQATTLWQLPQATPLLEHMLAEAEHHPNAGVVVAILTIAGEPGLVRSHLARLAGGSSEVEVLAHVNLDAYLLAFRGVDLEHAADVVQRFVAFFRERHQLQAAAGLARFRRHNDSLRGLLARAAANLELAPRVAPNGVYFAEEERQRSPGSTDVLLVEDDSLLGAVVQQALQNQGLRCQWLQDGAEALEALTTGRVQPRIVVLDVDLPGASGLEILRTLAQEQLLKRCRVIMLTLRSNEKETLETLALGAYDHVSKPASLPILVERVRLALHSL